VRIITWALSSKNGAPDDDDPTACAFLACTSIVAFTLQLITWLRQSVERLVGDVVTSSYTVPGSVLQGAEEQGSVVGVLVGEKCVIADPAMVCWRRSPPCRPPSSPAAALPRRLCSACRLRRRLGTWAAAVSASRARVDPRMPHRQWRTMGPAGISWCPTAGVAVRGGAPPAGLQRLEEVVEVRLDTVVLVVPLICSSRRRGGRIS